MLPMKKQFYDTHEPDDSEDEVYSGPSKSQKKRDAEQLQSLGKELSELAPEQLATIALPEALSEAIADLKKMKSFGAKRRQLQLIGKHMRALDAASVREAIDRATGASKAAVAAHHRAERLRDVMIAGDAPLTEYVTSHPEAPVQKLRQLVRGARREAADGKPPKNARELYKILYADQIRPLNLVADQSLEPNKETSDVL